MLNDKYSLTRINDLARPTGTSTLERIAQARGNGDGGSGNNDRFWGRGPHNSAGPSDTGPYGNTTTIDTTSYYVFWIALPGTTQYSAPYNDGPDI